MSGRHTSLRVAMSAAALVGVLAVDGCGNKGRYANDPRPPEPLNVTAAITDRNITLSPPRVGGGPILLIVSNQSGSSQDITVTSTGSTSNDAPAKTGLINPQGTGEVQVNLKPGSYEVAASKGSQPATLTVGPQRGSSQNEVLQP